MKNIIRLYFRLLSYLSPVWAGQQAFELFQKPLNGKIRDKEKSFYQIAKSFKIKHYLEDIHCYELGNPAGPLVLMVHGWESNAASLSAIALRLAEKGHHVILFNLPAHGYSKLKKTNLKVCKEVFLAVINHLNPQQPFSIVAHSFGSAVTAYALSKTTYHVDQLIFLTSPNKITQIFKDFADYIGLGSQAHLNLVQRAENILHEPLDQIRVDRLSSKIRYNNLLLIHDTDDKILPKSNSIEIYNEWPAAELHLIENTGHYRMLWKDKIIEKIVQELTPKVRSEKQQSVYALAF